MSNRKTTVALALFGAAVLLLNFPLIGLVSGNEAGKLSPILIYLGVIWVGFVICLYRIYGNKEPKK